MLNECLLIINKFQSYNTFCFSTDLNECLSPEIGIAFWTSATRRANGQFAWESHRHEAETSNPLIWNHWLPGEPNNQTNGENCLEAATY